MMSRADCTADRLETYHLAVIMSSGFDDTLTNLARPRTSAIITVRVIKSFEFRTERSLVLRDINLETTTVGGLKETVRNGGLVYVTSKSLSESTLGFGSNPDPARMETLSHYALWSANSPLPLTQSEVC